MAASGRLNLPDFCAARAVLAVVLIAELTAIVLSIARQDASQSLWIELARTSLFLLWAGLGSAAVLCALRRRLLDFSLPVASAIALTALLTVVGLVSLAAVWLGSSPWLDPRASRLILPTDPYWFLIANLAIGAVVGALVLRYFYVSSEWRRNIELEARARVNALQARIRPHFLFNSMNTIAALTRSDPRRAEAAVQDLADLFRATLSDKRSSITLKEELEVARIYQRIEQLRLGERLHVIWDVAELPMRAQVPSLLLQPLLENAIFHGIEPRHGGGIVTVRGTLEQRTIGIEVRNPLPSEGSESRPGNGLALGNISERVTLMYPEGASVQAGRVGDEFVVTLRFPFVEDENRAGLWPSMNASA